MNDFRKMRRAVRRGWVLKRIEHSMRLNQWGKDSGSRETTVFLMHPTKGPLTFEFDGKWTAEDLGL